MRKKSIDHVADSVMWYLIYLFPLILLLFMVVFASDPNAVLTNFVSWFEVNFSNNVIYDALNGLFGSGGTLPLFVGNWSFILYYFVYFVACLLGHLAIDVLVFIPRLAHKYMDIFTRCE